MQERLRFFHISVLWSWRARKCYSRCVCKPCTAHSCKSRFRECGNFVSLLSQQSDGGLYLVTSVTHHCIRGCITQSPLQLLRKEVSLWLCYLHSCDERKLCVCVCLYCWNYKTLALLCLGVSTRMHTFSKSLFRCTTSIPRLNQGSILRGCNELNPVLCPWTITFMVLLK